ncbi:50S ribosomal protein L35 [Candidatus Peregrinibacteria bacterium]|nr:50S ribosomal protein L35 [Candidatus Peregrinibacteria bacterium]
MKHKTHSGTKKRVKIKKRKIMLQKSCKKHLLTNKSKRQKKSFPGGKELDPAFVKKIRRLI